MYNKLFLPHRKQGHIVVNVPLFLYVAIWCMVFFFFACSSPADNKLPPTNMPDTIAAGTPDSVNNSWLKDSVAASGKRTLTTADIQYLDLIIIEEHPEIILFHENKPGTITFANELRRYFASRNADMRSNGIPTPDAEKGRSQKFYIHHVGDNLFRVYVFDEWGAKE